MSLSAAWTTGCRSSKGRGDILAMTDTWWETKMIDLKSGALAAAAIMALQISGPAAQAQAPAGAPTAASPLAQRIIQYDPATVRPCSPCHLGAGTAFFTGLLSSASIDAPLNFVHRGYVAPGASIGHHFHNRAEEMFVILDGEAQFTIDGRTSTIKGPAAVPDRMGRSHAIYNATDKPVAWMNIQVPLGPGSSAFDLGDTRVGAPLDPIPTFINTRFDRALLAPVPNMRGGAGTAQYRRAFDGAVFSTAWSYVDHVVLPPGASIGPQTPGGLAEIYYVMAGSGSVTVGAETAAIKTAQIVPVNTGQTRSVANNGAEPLELLVLGIAKDLAAKEAFLAIPRAPRPAPPPARP
jgi:mannose-6-phosphate isomerase-like protein (cupin superfamily)